MCRLGFISCKNNTDMTNWTRISTILYGVSNSDGTGIACSDGKALKIEKAGIEAKYFWLQNVVCTGKSLIFHTRKATHGDATNSNAHPFLGCNKDIAMCHNGVLFGEKVAKEALKNHTFTSETDSEVFLHAYEEHGNKFIKFLEEKDVTGGAVILFLKADGTILLYANCDDIKVYKTLFGLVGFSDDEIFKFDKKVDIKHGVLYEIKDGEVKSETKLDGNIERTYGISCANGCNYMYGKGFSIIDNDEENWYYAGNDLSEEFEKLFPNIKMEADFSISESCDMVMCEILAGKNDQNFIKRKLRMGKRGETMIIKVHLKTFLKKLGHAFPDALPIFEELMDVGYCDREEPINNEEMNKQMKELGYDEELSRYY